MNIQICVLVDLNLQFNILYRLFSCDWSESILKDLARIYNTY